jgi:hypothetical protein
MSVIDMSARSVELSLFMRRLALVRQEGPIPKSAVEYK